MKTDLFFFTQIYADFFLRLAFSDLRKSAKSVDDRFCFLRFTLTLSPAGRPRVPAKDARTADRRFVGSQLSILNHQFL